MRGGRGGLALVERPEDPSGALSVGKQLLCSEGPLAGGDLGCDRGSDRSVCGTESF